MVPTESMKHKKYLRIKRQLELGCKSLRACFHKALRASLSQLDGKWQESLLCRHLWGCKEGLSRRAACISPLAAVVVFLAVPIIAGFLLPFKDRLLQALQPAYFMVRDIAGAMQESESPLHGWVKLAQATPGLAQKHNAPWQVIAEINALPALRPSNAQVMQKTTAPTGAMLELSGNNPVLLTALGERTIKRLGDLSLAAASTSFNNGDLARIATGEQNFEIMLAEINYQSALDLESGIIPEPNWQPGQYGAEIFSGPRRHWTGVAMNGAYLGDTLFCGVDRMEIGAWLEMVRNNNAPGNRNTAKRASQYREYVEKFSRRYALPPSLVYAIMHIESSFNPVAVSSANALGLMQVVPQTAGGEVHAYLTGKYGIPNTELLFTPEKNIKYGTTYLHLLNNKHFKSVTDPLSRELCIIAAYNGGPNAVLRVFSRDKDEAVKQINKLAPAQLYATLTRSLPSRETRDYLTKVLNARNGFRLGGSTVF